MTPIVSQSFV